MSKRDITSDKKNQILRAVSDLLKHQGIQALSFENIAKEADISRQLVRYYYPDLDTLVVDMCDYLGGIYREILVAGVVEVGQVERLKFFLDFFFDLSEEHPMPVDLEPYDAMVAYAVGSAKLKERLSDQYRMLGHVIVHELAIAYPELDGSACEELSFLFVSMMHAHWSFVASLGYSREHSHLARKAIDRLIASYVADAVPVPAMDKPWSRDG